MISNELRTDYLFWLVAEELFNEHFVKAWSDVYELKQFELNLLVAAVFIQNGLKIYMQFKSIN